MRGKKDVAIFFFQIAYGKHRAYSLARLQANQIANMLAFAGSRDVGNLIHLEPIHASRVGENQNVSVRRRNK